jgi:hypothetical protein
LQFLLRRCRGQPTNLVLDARVCVIEVDQIDRHIPKTIVALLALNYAISTGGGGGHTLGLGHWKIFLILGSRRFSAVLPVLGGAQ